MDMLRLSTAMVLRWHNSPLLPHQPTCNPTGAASLRQRLHQLLTPLLRLVLAIVTALPASSAVREQVRWGQGADWRPSFPGQEWEG